MIVFDIPKVILQSREKVKIFNFLDFDHVWSLWTLYVCSGDMCVLLRHGICCMDMGHVFLWEKNMSSCWRRTFCSLKKTKALENSEQFFGKL